MVISLRWEPADCSFALEPSAGTSHMHSITRRGAAQPTAVNGLPTVCNAVPAKAPDLLTSDGMDTVDLAQALPTTK